MSKLIDFDTDAFLKTNWPDHNRLLKILEFYGVPVTYHAVYKWYYRKAIPANMFALLITIVEMEAGAPQSLIKYIVAKPAQD